MVLDEARDDDGGCPKLDGRGLDRSVRMNRTQRRVGHDQIMARTVGTVFAGYGGLLDPHADSAALGVVDFAGRVDVMERTGREHKEEQRAGECKAVSNLMRKQLG